MMLCVWMLTCSMTVHSLIVDQRSFEQVDVMDRMTPTIDV